MFIITLSGGSYSDYWERWYGSNNTLTHEELGQRMKSAYARVRQEYDHVSLENHTGKWAECSQLFGSEKWPWYLGFIGKKGTEAEFYAWRDKWDAKERDFLDMWMGECGLSRLRSNLEVDMGEHHSSYIYESDEVVALALCDQLIGNKKY